MPLTISADELRMIEDAEEELFLGIILQDHSVRLRRADRNAVIGYIEWLTMEPMSTVMRGFSLGVKKGRVVALYRSSTLNPGPFAVLEQRYVRRLLSLLPKAYTIRVFD